MSGIRRKRASKAGGRGIQSIEVGIRLLDALVRVNQPRTLSRLSRDARLEPSSAHRYLRSFVRTGFVRQLEASGRYDLGHFALRIGLAAIARIDILDTAAQRLFELCDRLQVTGMLSVWGERGPTVVRWQRSHTPLVTALGVGSVVPVLGSATGHVFLAWLPRQVTAAQVARELRARSVQDGPRGRLPKAVDELIERTRARGHASVDGRFIPGLRAVSCPILDMQGEATAALTLIDARAGFGGPQHRATRALRVACRELSRDNGYAGPASASTAARSVVPQR